MARKAEAKEITSKRKASLTAEKNDKSAKMKVGINSDARLVQALKQPLKTRSVSNRQTGPSTSSANKATSKEIATPLSEEEVVGSVASKVAIKEVATPIPQEVVASSSKPKSDASPKRVTDEVCKCSSCPIHQLSTFYQLMLSYLC